MIIEYITQMNDFINSLVWGPGMIILLISVGLFLNFSTGFLQIRRFGYMMRNTVMSLFSHRNSNNDTKGISPFQAVATAMAGTIGTGSIAGVATAIVSGGPGTVFWMWISAFLGMATKYSEIVLSIKFRTRNDNGEFVGGPMFYIDKGLGVKWLSILFAFFTMISCLGIGNSVQSNSISHALINTFGVKPNITGIVLTIISSLVILGGMKRISSVNEKLVPGMAVLYVGCSFLALLVNIERVPEAFKLIFTEAFNMKAVTGGTAGYGIMLAMRYGFSRGVFTNEAGLGSAPISHAASNTKAPVEQGLWGMFEVFFTTIIICTFSALVILTSDLWNKGKFCGSALSIAAFDSAIPVIGGIGVTLSTVFFALSTILGWAYYGEVSSRYLFKNSKSAVIIYRLIYVAVVFVGAVGSLDLIWSISETMNGLMAIPNLIALIGLNKVVRKETREYFGRYK